MALTYNIEFRADVSKVQTQLTTLRQDLSNAFELSLTGEIWNEFTAAKKSANALEAAMKKATTINGTSFVAMNSELKKAGVSASEIVTTFSSARMRNAASDFVNMFTFADRASLVLNDHIKEVGRVLVQSFKFTAAQEFLQFMNNSLQSGIHWATDLNKIMTDIAIVTTGEIDNYEKVFNQILEGANKLKIAAKEYGEAALIFYQQGLNTDEVERRTDITVKAAKAAKQSTIDMSEQLTAIWNTYQMQGDQLEKAASVAAKLGAETAVDFQYIAEAMQVAALPAAQLGVEYEQLAAIIATVGETSMQSASTIGNAYKTILARFGNLQAAGEDGEVELGRISTQLDMMGIHILDASSNLRDMGDVINEVGNNWNSYTDKQQMAIANTVGGVRQYGQFLALMENFNKYQTNYLSAVSEAVTNTALDEQFDIWSQSIEASAIRAKEAWAQAFSGLFEQDSLLGFNNAVAAIGNTFGDLLSSIGGLPGILTIAGVILQKQIVTGASNLLITGREIVSNLTLRGKIKASEAIQEQAIKATLDAQNVARKHGLYTQLAELEITSEKLNSANDLSETVIALQNVRDHGNDKERRAAQTQLDILDTTQKEYFLSIDNLKIKQDELALADLEVQNKRENLRMIEKNKKDLEFELELLSKREDIYNSEESLKRALNLLDEIESEKEILLLGEKKNKQILTRLELNKKNLDLEVEAAKIQKRDLAEKVGLVREDGETVVNSSPKNVLSLSQALTGVAMGAMTATMTIGQLSDMLKGEAEPSLGSVLSLSLSLGIALANLVPAASSLIPIAQAAIAANGGLIASLGALGKAALASPLMPFIIALGTAVAVINAVSNSIKNFSPETKLNNASSAAKNLRDSLDSAKKAANDLQTSFDKFADLRKNVDSLARGTTEWSDALKEANDYAISLLNIYPQLANPDYVERLNGQITFTEEGQRAAKAELDQAATKAALASTLANQQLRTLQLKQQTDKVLVQTFQQPVAATLQEPSIAPPSSPPPKEESPYGAKEYFANQPTTEFSPNITVNVTTPKEDTPPIKQTTPPKKEEDKQPVKQTTPPKKEEDTPPVKQSTPIKKEDKQPVKKEDKQPVKENTPPVKQSPPVKKEDKQPVKEDKQPVKQSTPVKKEDKQPVKEDKQPVKQSTPVKENTPPLKENTPPVKENTPPLKKEDKQPVKEDKQPVKQSTPVKKEDSREDVNERALSQEVLKKGLADILGAEVDNGQLIKEGAEEQLAAAQLAAARNKKDNEGNDQKDDRTNDRTNDQPNNQANTQTNTQIKDQINDQTNTQTNDYLPVDNAAIIAEALNTSFFAALDGSLFDVLEKSVLSVSMDQFTGEMSSDLQIFRDALQEQTQLGGDQIDSAVNQLKQNYGSTMELKRSLDADAKIKAIENENTAVSLLGDEIAISAAGEEIGQVAGRILGDISDKLLNKYTEAATSRNIVNGGTKAAKDAFDEYQSQMELKDVEVKNFKGNGNVVYSHLEDGERKTVEVTGDEIASILAANEAQTEFLNTTTALVAKYDELAHSIEGSDKAILSFLGNQDLGKVSIKNFEDLKSAIQATGSPLDYLIEEFGTLDENGVKQLDDKTAFALSGYSSGAEWAKALKKGIEKTEADWGEIDLSRWKIIGAEKLELAAAKKIQNALTNAEKGAMSNGGQEMSNYFNNIMEGLDPTQAETALNILANVDWSKWDAADGIIAALDQIGIKTNMTADDWKAMNIAMNEANNTLPIEKMKSLVDSMATLQTLIHGLNFGDIISEEDYLQLVAADSTLREIFLAMANGSYKLISEGDLAKNLNLSAAISELKEAQTLYDALAAEDWGHKNSSGVQEKIDWEGYSKGENDHLGTLQNLRESDNFMNVADYLKYDPAEIDKIIADLETQIANGGAKVTEQSKKLFEGIFNFTNDAAHAGTDVEEKVASTATSIRELNDMVATGGVTSTEAYQKAWLGLVGSLNQCKQSLSSISSGDFIGNFQEQVDSLELFDAQLQSLGLTTITTDFLTLTDAEQDQVLNLKRLELAQQAVNYSISKTGEKSLSTAASIKNLAKATAEVFDLDSSDLQNYAKHIMKVADSSDMLSDSLKENQQASLLVATSIMRANRGFEELYGTLDDIILSLTEADKESQRFYEALEALRSPMSDILNVDPTALTDAFLFDPTNLELLQSLLSGNTEALWSLQEAAASAYLDEIVTPDRIANIEGGISTIRDLEQAVWDAVDAGWELGEIPDPEIDPTGFIKACNQLVLTSGMSVEAAQKYFGNLGFNMKFNSEEETVKGPEIAIPTTEEQISYTMNPVDYPLIDLATGATTSKRIYIPGIIRKTVDATTTEEGPEQKVRVWAMGANEDGSATSSTGNILSFDNTGSGKTGAARKKHSAPNRPSRPAPPPSPPKGGGGGGGGSSKPPAAKKQPELSEPKKITGTKTKYGERFRDTNDALAEVERRLNKVADAESVAFGRNKLRLIIAKNVLLQEEAALYRRLQEEALDYLNTDSKAPVEFGKGFIVGGGDQEILQKMLTSLGGITATFDADGFVSNAEEIKNNLNQLSTEALKVEATFDEVEGEWVFGFGEASLAAKATSKAATTAYESVKAAYEKAVGAGEDTEGAYEEVEVAYEKARVAREAEAAAAEAGKAAYENSVAMFGAVEDQMETINKAAEKAVDSLNRQVSIINEWLSNKITEIDYRLELRLQINAADLKQIDFLMNRLGERAKSIKMDKFNEQAAIALKQAKQLIGSYEKLDSILGKKGNLVVTVDGDYNELLKAIDPEAWKEFEANGGVMTDQLMQSLNAKADAAQQTIEDLYSYSESMFGAFHEALNLYIADFDRLISVYDSHTSMLNSWQEIWRVAGTPWTNQQLQVDLLNKSIETQSSKVEGLNTKYKVMNRELEKAEQHYREAIEAHGVDSNIAQKTLAEWQQLQSDTQQAKASLWEEVASMLSMIEGAAAASANVIVNKFTSGLGAIFADIDSAMEVYDQQKTLDNFFMNPEDLGFEISQMIKELDDEMKDISEPELLKTLTESNEYLNALIEKRTVVTKKLGGLEEEQIYVAKDNIKMSQKDLDILKAQLDLEKEKAAFTDQQNAKNTMRLARDASGNWNYIYSQDNESQNEDQVGKIEEKTHNLRKLIRDARDEAEEMWLQTEISARKLEEAVLEDRYQQDASYRRQIDTQRQIIGETLDFLAGGIHDYNEAIGGDFSQTTLAIVTDMGDMLEINDKYKKNTADMGEALKQNFTDYQSLASDKLALVGVDYDTLELIVQKETEKIIEENQANERAIDKLTQTSIKDLDEIMRKTTEWGEKWRTEIRSTIFYLEEMIAKIREMNAAQINEEVAGKTYEGNLLNENKEALDTLRLLVRQGNTLTADQSEYKEKLETANYERSMNVNQEYYKSPEWLAYSNNQRANLEPLISALNLLPTKISSAFSIGAKALTTEKPITFDTGGLVTGPTYAGLAMDGKKELVLNSDDTKNMLAALEITRSSIASYLGNLGNIQAAIIEPPNKQISTSESIPPQVIIQADFPHVSAREEIEAAFSNLVNQSAQYQLKNYRN
jgi:TP901 family phage tail tape measure protein